MEEYFALTYHFRALSHAVQLLEQGACFAQLSLSQRVTKAHCLQVLGFQVDVYQHLGAGPVAFLYGQMANEQEATLEEVL